MSEPIKQAIIQADPKLGGIPREYLYDGNRLIETYIVRVDGERCRMVDRKAEVGEKVIVVTEAYPNSPYTSYRNGDIFVAGENEDEILSLSDSGARLFHSEYHVLEPMKHYCGWCSAELGEIACSNNRGGSYCSAQCADADEEVEPQLTEINAEKVIDMITELAQTVAQQQREIDRLKQLTEENAKNTLTLAEDLEQLKHKAEFTQTQSSRVDLTTEFLIEDLVALGEKIRKLGGEGR
jgi:hypothetical protein